MTQLVIDTKEQPDTALFMREQLVEGKITAGPRQGSEFELALSAGALVLSLGVIGYKGRVVHTISLTDLMSTWLETIVKADS